jgi:hypothetical protein
MQERLANAYADRAPCIVATADPSGSPDLSYRGSVIALDERRLAFWERSAGPSRAHLQQQNPRVCVLYRFADGSRYWRFYGKASLLDRGEERERIYSLIPAAEQSKDPERKGLAVVVEVDLVREGPRAIQSASEG